MIDILHFSWDFETFFGIFVRVYEDFLSCEPLVEMITLALCFSRAISQIVCMQAVRGRRHDNWRTRNRSSATKTIDQPATAAARDAKRTRREIAREARRSANADNQELRNYLVVSDRHRGDGGYSPSFNHHAARAANSDVYLIPLHGGIWNLCLDLDGKFYCSTI